MKGSIVNSYKGAGGLNFGLFIAYVIIFGTAWFFGAQKRDGMRLAAVEKQLARDRAAQTAMNMD